MRIRDSQAAKMVENDFFTTGICAALENASISRWNFVACEIGETENWRIAQVEPRRWRHSMASPLLQCSKHVEKKKDEKLFNLQYMETSKSF